MFTSNSQESSRELIEITADEMEWDDINNIAHAKGNAKAVQGIRILKADLLIARISDASTKETVSNEIHTIDALGNVFFSSKDEQATGSKGRYNVIDEIIVLEGKVKVIKGKDVIFGEKLKINLKTGKSSVLSKESDNKVKMKFTPATRK